MTEIGNQTSEVNRDADRLEGRAGVKTKRQKSSTPPYQLAQLSTPSCSGGKHDLTGPLATLDLMTSRRVHGDQRPKAYYFYNSNFLNIKQAFPFPFIWLTFFKVIPYKLLLVYSVFLGPNFCLSLGYYHLCEKADKNRHSAGPRTCGSCPNCR